MGSGAGLSVSTGLILKGKAGFYFANNEVNGFEASLGIQASFLFSDIDLKDFRLNTLDGYGEGVQGGGGPAGGSLFRSYDGVYKNVKNKGDWFSHKEFQKGKLLYHAFSYGLGIGPEDISYSGSLFRGNTTFIGELTNIIKENN